MKRRVKIIGGVIGLSFMIGLGVFSIYSLNQDDQDIEQGQVAVEKVYKESPFTAEEMYEYIQSDTFPTNVDAFYDVLTDWYSYFDEDTPFKNRYGESLTYDEYSFVVHDMGYERRHLEVLLRSQPKDVFLNFMDDK